MRTSPCTLVALATVVGLATLATAQPIDRRALVERNSPRVRQVDPRSPLSVGNGQFAFTADVTGLQSLGDTYYAEGIPTETLARWAWHSEPNPKGYTLADASVPFDSPRGTLLLPTRSSGPAGEWLRRNPHQLPLAQIRLEYADGVGAPLRRLRREDLTDIDQRLDSWNGLIESGYTLGGRRVHVTTAVHPAKDGVGIRIDSPLVAEGRLRVVVAFPRGHRLDIKNTPPLDWSEPDTHVTREVGRRPGRLDLERALGDTRFRVALASNGRLDTGVRHEVAVTADGPLDLTVTFAPTSPDAPTVDEIVTACREHWPAFWKRGAAIDFAGSTDPRAAELERRVVLSQYLTAIQSVASIPPQETGLTCNTWYGKHHTEMIAWHTAHFALWGRGDLLARNLEWYRDELPMARNLAKERGLSGARWPKMVGPEGRESPGGNPLIVWNQPHPIQLAELLYRGAPNDSTLARYRDLVFETAEGLASMVHLDGTGRYVLGPPLWIAQEIYDQRTSQNPSFELAYWSWALETAQRWRERLGLSREPQWDDILARLTPLPVSEGLYVALGSNPDTFRNLESRRDHPTMLAPLGLLPGPGVDIPHHAPDPRRSHLDVGLRGQDLGLGLPHDRHDRGPTRRNRGRRRYPPPRRPQQRLSTNGHCPQRSDMVGRPGAGRAGTRSPSISRPMARS